MSIATFLTSFWSWKFATIAYEHNRMDLLVLFFRLEFFPLDIGYSISIFSGPRLICCVIVFRCYYIEFLVLLAVLDLRLPPLWLSTFWLWCPLPWLCMIISFPISYARPLNNAGTELNILLRSRHNILSVGIFGNIWSNPPWMYILWSIIKQECLNL